MLKAILRYTDSCKDGQRVFMILAQNNIKILKTIRFVCNPRVTILVDDYEKLNRLLFDLNTNCYYEVSLIKVKKNKRKTKILEVQNGSIKG